MYLTTLRAFAPLPRYPLSTIIIEGESGIIVQLTAVPCIPSVTLVLQQPGARHQNEDDKQYDTKH
jgi:hypothetical protein